LKPIILDERLMVLEVYRYLLLEQKEVVALDRSLNQREWLIGLLLLQKWTVAVIDSIRVT
jgi:hypothetical protein